MQSLSLLSLLLSWLFLSNNDAVVKRCGGGNKLGGQLIDTFVVGWLDLCFMCYLDDAFAAATFVTDIFIETN